MGGLGGGCKGVQRAGISIAGLFAGGGGGEGSEFPPPLCRISGAVKGNGVFEGGGREEGGGRT